MVFLDKTRKLTVVVDLVAEMTVINPFDFFVEDAAEYMPFTYNERLHKELIPYLELHEDGPLLRDWVDGSTAPHKTIDFLVDLNQRLWKDVAYSIRMEPGVQTCEETLTKALGSCRDSAWLLVQILRRLGLAARFVSGYLVQLAADVKSLDGPSGPETTLPICTLGPRCSYREPVGWGWTRPRGFLREKATFPWHVRRIRPVRPLSQGPPIHARSSFASLTRQTNSRRSARHQALQRRSMGGDRGSRP